jgi:peptide/nickel transport system substrate-binding protein
MSRFASHRLGRRHFFRAVGAVAGSAWLAGCAGRQSTPPANARPTEWNMVVAEATGGADVLSEYGTNNQWGLQWHVMEPLLDIELLPDGKSWGVVNILAESWSFPSPTTFRVVLKKGVKFQNGEELTAEHVKYAFDSIVNAERPLRRTTPLKLFGEAEMLDPYTVQWNMPAPNSSVLGLMYHLLIPPLARRHMTAEEFEAHPTGTGPYKVIEWPRDGTVRLEAWDGYRGGKPTPERLTIRQVPEPSTRVLELLSGNAQIAQAIPIEAIGSIRGNPTLEVTNLKGSSSLSYVINLFVTNPPLRDKRVRQAMNYAVDREAIVNTILGGYGTLLPGPLWDGWLGYSLDVQPYPYDPEKAKALLAEAGYPNGFSFKWTVTQGVFVKDIEVAQAVANQLAKVDIHATLQPLERARLLAERNEGEYEMTSLIWPISWHPASMMAFTLWTSFPDAKLSAKWGPVPPELVEARRLAAEAAAATNVEQMQERYARLNKFMHDEAFWLFVHTVDELWGIQKDVRWRPYPVNYQRYYDYWAMMGKQAPADPAVPLVFK